MKGVTNMGKSIKLADIEKELMKDNEFKEEYEKLRPYYEIVSQLINARVEQNITQEELAKRIGTKKSCISRLESGNYNPSLKFLQKVADGLGINMYISFR